MVGNGADEIAAQHDKGVDLALEDFLASLDGIYDLKFGFDVGRWIGTID
jgi:hypothetical protein